MLGQFLIGLFVIIVIICIVITALVITDVIPPIIVPTADDTYNKTVTLCVSIPSALLSCGMIYICYRIFIKKD